MFIVVNSQENQIMILKLTASNFRSFKDQIEFSMIPSSSLAKSGNIAIVENFKGESIKYLKSAAIFGPNASGKSNLIRVLFFLRKQIIDKPKVDEGVELYDPHIFDTESERKPSSFEIEFLIPVKGELNFIKYLYKVSVDSDKIISESLDYYPNGKESNLIKRNEYVEDTETQTAIVRMRASKKTVNIFKNQLTLSKYGIDEPHDIITPVFRYFENLEIINAVDSTKKRQLYANTSDLLDKDPQLKTKVEKLLRIADTQVKEVKILNLERELKESGENHDETIKSIVSRNPWYNHGVHEKYNNKIVIGEEVLPLLSESQGTITLFALGGQIMNVLSNGGVLIVDELDTSLHFEITKLITGLFLSPDTNPKNAQLIFTTHDTSLLDRDVIRRDQVWFTEKDDFGISQLYSLQDFDNLREDTPFDKWYQAGKFGAVPNLSSIGSL